MNYSAKVKTVKEFYKTYKSWCKGRDFPALLDHQIDEFIVVYDQETDEPLYATVFWNTPSSFCIIGYPVGSSKTTGHKKALTYLMSACHKYAKSLRYTMIWTTSSTPRVIDSLLEAGFKKGDENVDHYCIHTF